MNAHFTGFATREMRIYTLLILTFNPKEDSHEGQSGFAVYCDSQWEWND